MLGQALTLHGWPMILLSCVHYNHQTQHSTHRQVVPPPFKSAEGFLHTLYDPKPTFQQGT
jgi:hypothetical protein